MERTLVQADPQKLTCNSYTILYKTKLLTQRANVADTEAHTEVDWLRARA